MKHFIIITLLLSLGCTKPQKQVPLEIDAMYYAGDTTEIEAAAHINLNPGVVRIAEIRSFSLKIYQKSSYLSFEQIRNSTGEFVNVYDKKYLHMHGDTVSLILRLLELEDEERTQLTAANEIFKSRLPSFHLTTKQNEKITKLVENEVWITGYKKQIPVKQMTTSHINNCIKCFEEDRVIPPGYLGGKDKWLGIFTKELQSRV